MSLARGPVRGSLPCRVSFYAHGWRRREENFRVLATPRFLRTGRRSTTVVAKQFCSRPASQRDRRRQLVGRTGSEILPHACPRLFIRATRFGEHKPGGESEEQSRGQHSNCCPVKLRESSHDPQLLPVCERPQEQLRPEQEAGNEQDAEANQAADVRKFHISTTGSIRLAAATHVSQSRTLSQRLRWKA